MNARMLGVYAIVFGAFALLLLVFFAGFQASVVIVPLSMVLGLVTGVLAIAKARRETDARALLFGILGLLFSGVTLLLLGLVALVFTRFF